MRRAAPAASRERRASISARWSWQPQAATASGAARGSRGAAFIRVGHSISAGLLIEGEIFRGVTGKAGQIGHVTIDENGPICRCGSRGCLDTLAGGPALLELFREGAVAFDQVSPLGELSVRWTGGDAPVAEVEFQIDEFEGAPVGEPGPTPEEENPDE